MMHSPPPQLHPISTTHYYMSGDITIGEGAAIAPGVLLQADLGSRIVIGVGVCIGMGSVIHASGGTLEIRAGAIIGAGVLMVGVVTVGDGACVGAATTVFNRSIDPGAMIPPSSLLSAESVGTPEPYDPWDDRMEPPQAFAQKGQPKTFSQNGQPQPESFSENGQPKQSSDNNSPTPSDANNDANNSAIVQKSNLQPGVYGQLYVNQLLGKLLPNHKSDQ